MKPSQNCLLLEKFQMYVWKFQMYVDEIYNPWNLYSDKILFIW